MLDNLLDPAILFFFLGAVTALLGSNLEIPSKIAKFLSLYLLMSIGLKGGFSLNETGITKEAIITLIIAIVLAFIIPAYLFLLLRLKYNAYNAAAIAATYGSVSAVTYIAAQSFLYKSGIEYGGYMTVALVIMESPAIMMAFILSHIIRNRNSPDNEPISLKNILRESFTDGAMLLLLGSLLIGYISGSEGKKMLMPFSVDIFKGFLAFFLLDMGILVGSKILQMKRIDYGIIILGIVIPFVNALLAIFTSYIFSLSIGDTLLLSVLCASGSYIVVPAVLRYAVPEANPGIYFTMALAVTFPFNLIVGIPLYFHLINILWG